MKRVVLGIGWRPFAALVVGVASFFLLIYFYMAQRNFEYNYKEVRGYFHTIDRSYHRLNYQILRTSLFAYSNQDVVTGELAGLKKEYEALRSNAFLARGPYAGTAKNVASFGEKLAAYEASIDDFMMLNAGIKNSFVYITSLSAEKVRLFEDEPDVYNLLLSIIAEVSQARILADASFLQGLETKAMPLGQLPDITPEQAALIRSLMIHIHFISVNYPGFVKAVNRVENTELDHQIEIMETVFINEAKTDYAMLDRFVIILLTLFLTALTLVVGLLIRAGYENRRLRQLEEQLRHSLSHDHLTGLKSRSKYELMQDAFVRPTLILLNIDHFKHINDFYGSAAGNAILKEVGLLIRQPVLEPFRPEFFRLGGDDFGIVLQNIETERARQLGMMLKQSIESYAFSYDNIEVFITVSVAINCTKPLLENADLVLKHEKLRHAEGVVLFSESMHLKENAKMNIAMTHEIKKALDRDAVIPWYQPIVDLRTGEVVKYEALVRIQAEDGTISGPATFLGTAMQTPYYRKITATMFEKVLASMDGYPYRFSINLGMRDLQDEKLVSMLIDLLDEHRDRAKRLDIELLESEELDDIEVVRSFIAKVKTYGCQISIDDFGMGYSNFSYVMELEIDVLKIDGSLISNVVREAKTRHTVETIVRFAQLLGLRVVAEFVEDQETVDLLRSMGVEYAQGYFFGRPSPSIVYP